MTMLPDDLTIEDIAAAAPTAPPSAGKPARAARPTAASPTRKASAPVLSLAAHMCKWPIGDPSTDDFAFCEGRSTGDSPYCLEHERLAYQPARGRSPASGAASPGFAKPGLRKA